LRYGYWNLVSAALGFSEGDQEQFLVAKAGERFEQALSVSPTCADDTILNAVVALSDPTLMRLLDISRAYLLLHSKKKKKK
jgi:hypothetical protein